MDSAVAAVAETRSQEGYLDAKLYLEHTLSQAVSGRIGLWSKSKQLHAPVDYMATPARLSVPVQVEAMVEPHVQS